MPSENKHQPAGEASPTYEREVDIAKLLPTFEQLVLGLGKAGFGGEELAQLLDTKIQMECRRCQIRLSSQELLDISLKSASVLHAKLQRVKIGDCARAGCIGRFYRVKCLPDASVNWDAVWPSESLDKQPEAPCDRFRSALATVDGVAGCCRSGFQWWLQAPLRGKLAAGVLFLLAWYWAFDFGVPGFAKRGRVFLVEQKSTLRSNSTRSTNEPGNRFIVRETPNNFSRQGTKP